MSSNFSSWQMSMSTNILWSKFMTASLCAILTSWMWETMAAWVSMSSNLIFSIISSLRSHWFKHTHKHTRVEKLKHVNTCPGWVFFSSLEYERCSLIKNVPIQHFHVSLSTPPFLCLFIHHFPHDLPLPWNQSNQYRWGSRQKEGKMERHGGKIWRRQLWRRATE